jgi:signal transduction histidine kinase
MRQRLFGTRRTLYVKIFGWFLLTATLGSLAVLAVTIFSGSQPLGSRWMRVTQDLYASSAVDFYESGGKPELARYLDTLRKGSGMDARLLFADGSDVLGVDVPPHTGDVLQQSRLTGHSSVRLGRIWTAASPVAYEGTQFYFVAEVHPLRGFLDGTFAAPLTGRFLLGLLIVALLCGVLARHIVRPIRALQHAALRLAAGDLNTRVLPAIGHRDDELADTARAFDEMAGRMQTLLQKRQMLLADISHELRSPLTRLSVSLELMRRGETDVLEQAHTDVDRMNEMIGQILLLTRLDTELAPPEFAKVSLLPMLRSIVEDAGFEGKQQSKTVTLDGDVDCIVMADANLLRSGLENIVRNAVHYTAVDTAVEVRARLVGGSRCEIVVGDRGPGVPVEALPFLFDPFYRISESRDRAQGGTGLGLSISQKVVALHDGTIEAVNRDGAAGLIVRVTLPCG